MVTTMSTFYICQVLTIKLTTFATSAVYRSQDLHLMCGTTARHVHFACTSAHAACSQTRCTRRTTVSSNGLGVNSWYTDQVGRRRLLKERALLRAPLLCWSGGAVVGFCLLRTSELRFHVVRLALDVHLAGRSGLHGSRRAEQRPLHRGG